MDDNIREPSSQLRNPDKTFKEMYDKSDIGDGVTDNYDYFMGLDVSPYVGSWVAICDEKVVAHSKSFKEVYAQAKEKCGRSKPFIAMVPTDETMIL